ncbi:MAG: hypothetical protein JW843_09700 [Candidatus Aminicenantes bacterium]|nr:hypothetical protein [Candidatus Aminicenantes bacterium]
MRPPAAVIALSLAAASFLPTACRKPTDREQVLSLVSVLARAAEKDDTEQILELLDPAYVDFEGRSKPATGDMLEKYFSRYPAIVVNILRSEVEEMGPQEAVVAADVALSSGAAKVLRKLAQLSLSNHRFRIKLRKSGQDWLIAFAEWRPLEAGEIILPQDKGTAGAV